MALATAGAAAPVLLKLGTSNTEPRTTVLTNTGNGPAVHLRVKPGTAPLRVNSKKTVSKLSAGFLRGKTPQSFMKAGSAYTRQQANTRFGANGVRLLYVESIGVNENTTTMVVGPIAHPGATHVKLIVMGTCHFEGTTSFDVSVRIEEVGMIAPAASIHCDGVSGKDYSVVTGVSPTFTAGKPWKSRRLGILRPPFPRRSSGS